MAKSKAKSSGAASSVMPPNGALCGCCVGIEGGTGKTRDGVGPGAHAAGVDPDIRAANLKHLKRIEGQVRGIASMIEEDRYCADIIQQCAAVQESLRSVAKNLYRNHLKHCAVRAMHDPGPERDRMIKELLDLSSRLTR
jgi:DNA-binding FrmR family transcriptional regulator